MTEIDKSKAIKADMKKLKDTLREIPADKLKMADGLISNAAFMAATLQELKEEINSRGAITEYNGNPVENPVLKSYNTMINRYAGVMAQLLNLLPKEIKDTVRGEENTKVAELKAFIGGGGK